MQTNLTTESTWNPAEVIKNTCPCGHHVDHPQVGYERIYGIWMSLAQFLGVTPIPQKIVWFCRDCGKDFAFTKDKEICHYFAT